MCSSDLMMYYGNSGATTTSSASNTYFNPISYWYLDGNVNDALGVNDLTNNGATSTTGKIGTAYSFSGSNVAYSSNGDLLLTAPMSASLWFKSTTTSTDAMMLVKIVSNYGHMRYSLELQSGKVVSRYYDGSGAIHQLTSPLTYNDGVWHQAVYVRTTTNHYLYVDGSLVDSGTAPNTYLLALERQFTLGAFDDDAGYKNFYVGKLDEVSIYNKALTSTQINELYQQTAPTFTIGTEQVQFACNFNGTVKDENGVAISSARVVLMNATSDDFVTNTTTDINGLWSVGVLNHGNYSVYAYQPGNFTRPGDIKVNIKC